MDRPIIIISRITVVSLDPLSKIRTGLPLEGAI